MKKAFNEVNRIATADTSNLGQQLEKLFEEVGEVAKDVNTITGMRTPKKGEDFNSTRKNLVEEMASTIQCLFCIATKAGISYKEIRKQIDVENLAYDKFVKKHRSKK